MDSESRRRLLSAGRDSGHAAMPPSDSSAIRRLSPRQLPEQKDRDVPSAVRSGGLEARLSSAIPAAANESGSVSIPHSAPAGYDSLRAPSVTASRERATSHSNTVRLVALAAAVFLAVALPRLYVLFFVTEPQNPGLGWYGDTYHHWQIAYLSKEVGFSHGFLRLWDFKGMEYFWGLLHPLLLGTLFAVTGSVDILVPRLVGVVGAGASLTALFFLLRRHFNIHVAVAGALFAAFNPVAMFSDTVGMQESLGLTLLFGGLLLWPRRAAWTGVMWALAGMVRAEYWVFGFALVAVAATSNEDSNPKLALGLGWMIPSLLYMKYMLDHTGNPIYPVYWNFLGGTAGEWMVEAPLTPDRVAARWIARAGLVAAGAAALWLVWKRPKQHLLLLLGLGNIMLIGIILGIGAYIHGFTVRIVFDRLMVVPYMYLGIFLTIGVLWLLPRLEPRRLWLSVGWVIALAVVSVSQLAWGPLLDLYRPLNSNWELERTLAEDVAAAYTGGTISIPEDRPALTYALVRYHGVTGRELDGQKYDPFAYFEGDPFADWSESREVLSEWIADRNIQLLVFYTGKSHYEEMIRREPNWFSHKSTVHRGTIQIYEVNL